MPGAAPKKSGLKAHAGKSDKKVGTHQIKSGRDSFPYGSMTPP